LVPTVSMSAATNVQTFLEKSVPSAQNTALPIMVIIHNLFRLLKFCFLVTQAVKLV